MSGRETQYTSLSINSDLFYQLQHLSKLRILQTSRKALSTYRKAKLIKTPHKTTEICKIILLFSETSITSVRQTVYYAVRKLAKVL